MKPVVYFGAVTLLRQDIHLQSQGQGDSLVMSCRVFFQKLYLEIFDAFHKCADGISAHRASVRMWSKPRKTLLLSAKGQPTLLPDCESPKGFRSRPRTVTRLQCWGSMAIPSRERTQKVLMRVWWLKEHHLHLFAAIVSSKLTDCSYFLIWYCMTCLGLFICNLLEGGVGVQNYF